jgi:DNA-binding winged helix-turn-helix (wHTH) protein/Tol biopolymer transport system component
MVNDGKNLVFRFGDFELREREHRLLRAGEQIHLQPQVFRLLLYLVRNRDRVVEKDDILREVWDSAAVTDNSLTRAISLLRKILDDDTRDSRAIRTVSSIGYQFVCAVEQAEDCAASSKWAEAASQESAQPEALETPVAASAGKQKRNLQRFERVRLLASVIGVLALLAAGVSYLRRPFPPPRITAYTQITHDGKTKSVAATDGPRLYVNFSSPNLIAQLGVNGGEFGTLPITIPGTGIFITDVSPDGSNALINDLELGHSSYSMWIAPVLGGASKRLDDGYFGAFSPDSGSVIYSTSAGEIFMIRPDGTAKHKLASVAPVPTDGAAFGFAWSPDGKSIRFSTMDNTTLWEMNANGSGLHRLFPDWKEQPAPCCGRWTRDGGLYLFQAGGQIWALDERRSLFRRPSPVPVQVTSGPIRWDQPIPGEDGRTIFAGGATLRGELSRIDPKTGDLRPFLGGISAQDASFSPDGKSVAYVAFPEGTLWRADPDGSRRVQLTQPPDSAGNPRWSPNAKEIVVGTISPNGHFSIRRISAADGTPLWLMSDNSAEAHDPNWSPDGTRVLYCMGVPSFVPTAKQDLRIVDLRSKQTTILPGSEGKWSPRWSPDGRFIAAFLDGPQQPNPSLPIFDSTTRKWHAVQVNGAMGYLSFSHDSRFIYFLRYGRDQGVFRIPVVGGKEERVVDLTDWHLAGYFGYSMSLDPDDAPLVLRDTGNDDIYALTLDVK